MGIKGTETEKNLLKAFAGESQARNRYTYFASAANKEGYKQIEAIFLETAENEKEHAKKFFKYLEGGAVEITASYPAGVIGKTFDNLIAAAEGENEEHRIIYKEMAETAEKEGFKEIAVTYRNIAKVEMEHEARYRKLAANIEKGEVFKKSKPIRWKCRNCGYMHEGTEVPEKCPACQHPQAHVEIAGENY